MDETDATNLRGAPVGRPREVKGMRYGQISIGDVCDLVLKNVAQMMAKGE